jgi:hypothetical protein
MTRRPRALKQRRPPSLKRLGTYVLLLVLPCFAGPHSLGQNASADEYEIRAAMLFNLTRFIEWPSWKMDSGHPEFDVCILGSDPIGPELDSSLRNKMVGSKPLVVRHLSSAEAASACHILYISAGERKSLAKLSATMARNAVLTISEGSNSDNREQVIGLPTVDEHVRIDVNLSAAQRSGLTISSKLLHLATVSQ